MIGYSTKEKETRIKFNPELALIGLWTGPITFGSDKKSPNQTGNADRQDGDNEQKGKCVKII